jgi:hypothetical protein
MKCILSQCGKVQRCFRFRGSAARVVRKAFGFPAHASPTLREAAPRDWQGAALLSKRKKLGGKAEPFRTARRQSRSKSALELFKPYLALIFYLCFAAVTAQAQNWPSFRGNNASGVADGHSTPLVYGDYLYISADNGVLTAYNARTGERIYQQRLPSTFSASPVAADGKLYLASEDGDVFVIRAGPKFELLATNSMGQALMATPAISDGMIILRAQGYVYAIAERAKGKPKSAG